MHSKRFMIFAAAVCVAAMLSYLFVFADAPLPEALRQDATTAQ
jgi:hypothetical protein